MHLYLLSVLGSVFFLRKLENVLRREITDCSAARPVSNNIEFQHYSRKFLKFTRIILFSFKPLNIILLFVWYYYPIISKFLFVDINTDIIVRYSRHGLIVE